MPSVYLDHPGPIAFAHRGGAAHGLENTWPAFEHAVKLGYRYLETDVQATSDGVLLAFHDRTLDRMTGRPGRIAKLRHHEVMAAKVGGSEPIPQMADLLDAWPDVRFNIDVKDALAVRALADVLRGTAAWDRVCVTSFSERRLRAIRATLDRPVCMTLGPLGVAGLRLLGVPPAPFGVPLAEPSSTRPARSFGALPLRRHGDRLGHRGYVRCAQIPAAFAGVQVSTARFVRQAHARGLQVHVWTVNDPVEMRRLLDLGVDGVMTDDTVALRDLLVERGQWYPHCPG